MKESNWQTLLNRWISGRITAPEEQELDRAARKDPFLSDALEGYRQQPEDDHAEQIAKLRAKLKKKQKRRVVPIWRIAAAVAVLIIAGISMWQFNTNGGRGLAQMETATEENLPTPKAFDDAPPTAYDKTTSEESVKEVIPNQEQLAQAITPKPSVKTDKAVKSIASANKSTPTAAPEVVFPAEPPVTKEIPQADLPEIALAEQIAAAEISSKEGGALIEKDREKAEESVTDVPSNYQVLSPKAETAPTFTNPTAPKKKALDLVAPRPSIDSIAYRQYIKDNLRYPDAAKSAGATGSVTLRFSFDENGKPFNFFLLKSMGYGCDEEAIRLLREGPAWIATEYSIMTYSIQFDL